MEGNDTLTSVDCSDIDASCFVLDRSYPVRKNSLSSKTKGLPKKIIGGYGCQGERNEH